jgi:CheY-like chemotaxis protein
MHSPPVVLVVEDNAELRNVLKEALGAEGYRVLATRDEAEALEVLRGTHIDLFISDLTDPPTAELTLEAMRKEFPELPMVALSETGGNHPTLFSSWEQPHGFRTLPRPFRLGELLALSREVLGPGHGAPGPASGFR